MSITFWAPKAPSSESKFPCLCEGDPQCSFCKGTGEEIFSSSLGEFNVANGSGFAIQRWLGFPEPDWGGTLPLAKLEILEQGLLSLQEDPRRLAFGADLHFGSNQDRANGYLTKMLALVRVARKASSPLSWG